MDSRNNPALFDSELIDHWKMIENRPKVIVFDLDHTLWPFYVDLEVRAPFRKETHFGRELILDSDNNEIECFADVRKILHTLKRHCLENCDEHLAVASKALSGQVANELIDILDFRQYFTSIQIYSEPTKENHMHQIKLDTQIENYENFLFYDDNKFNVRDVKKLGVFSYLVNKNVGLNLNAVHNSLELYNRYNRN